MLAKSAIDAIISKYGKANVVLITSDVSFQLAQLLFEVDDFVKFKLNNSWHSVFLNVLKIIMLRLFFKARFVNLVHSTTRKAREFQRSFKSSILVETECKNHDHRIVLDPHEQLPLELANHYILLKKLCINIQVSEIYPTIRRRSISKGIIICPCGSSTIRDIPKSLLSLVIRLCLDHSDLDITICLAPGQQDRLKGGISENQYLSNRIRLVTNYSFKDFLNELQSARFVIGAETFSSHYSIALGTPTVVFVGGGHYGRFGPWSITSEQIWLTSFRECFQCDWQCSYLKPYCITEINSDRVKREICRILKIL